MKNETDRLTIKRKYPIGAEIIDDELNFRIWAPANKNAELIIEHPHSESIEMQHEENGYFSATIKKLDEKTLYRFKFPDSETLFPDPASRFQPQGPKGPSQIIETSLFKWTDLDWPGANSKNQIIYEMHIGTFTKEGTWRAAAAELQELANLGITVIEIMPIADFLGEFGWGYDGICLFAPWRLYGEPEDLVEFINTAHKCNLAVILDIVYNHFGPGSFIEKFSESYFSTKSTEWGKCINFDGPKSEYVRKFYIANALYWIQEYHFDGFRMDAAQQIHDSSQKNIIAEIVENCRQAAGEKSLYIIAENESQNVKLFGYGVDGMWNDDFHHSINVALTGKNEAYYSDYLGTAEELVSALKFGYIYQGQFSKWQQQRRGTWSRNIDKNKFVCYIQNHDQIANSVSGLRINKLISDAKNRAATAFLLLGPWTPLIFQGQEFNASTPFLYFANASLSIDKDRKNFLEQFPTIKKQETKDVMDDPSDENTFLKCKLNLVERKLNNKFYSLFNHLINLKKTDEIFSLQGQCDIDDAVLNDNAFVIRFLKKENGRLLIVNFGKAIFCSPASQPLFAPYKDYHWDVVFSTESLEYGGDGFPEIESVDGWYIPPECTLVLELKKM
jgi:maltooligosyltrehalose trehalohydrolase